MNSKVLSFLGKVSLFIWIKHDWPYCDCCNKKSPPSQTINIVFYHFVFSPLTHLSPPPKKCSTVFKLHVVHLCVYFGMSGTDRDKQRPKRPRESSVTDVLQAGGRKCFQRGLRESAVYIFSGDLKVAVYPSSLASHHPPLLRSTVSVSGQISPTVGSAGLCGGLFILERGLPSGSLHLSKHPPGRCSVFPASHCTPPPPPSPHSPPFLPSTASMFALTPLLAFHPSSSSCHLPLSSAGISVSCHFVSVVPLTASQNRLSRTAFLAWCYFSGVGPESLQCGVQSDTITH